MIPEKSELVMHSPKVDSWCKYIVPFACFIEAIFKYITLCYCSKQMFIVSKYCLIK